jgi:16S rRNA (uracil1498-N3)-methyltransferase
MQLFYIPTSPADFCILDADESQHCIRVLRLKQGDRIFLTDGKGNLYEGEIQEDHPRRCTVQILNVSHDDKEKKSLLHLAIAPTKNISRLGWFLEKATEIGIDEITPLICEHSERKTLNTGRLQKILISAMKQSLKTYLPLLNQPKTFIEAIKTGESSQKFIAFYDEPHPHLKDVYVKGKNTLILIGPEGDFSEKEILAALDQGFVAVNLGHNRLRTETAGIVACHTVSLLNE